MPLRRGRHADRTTPRVSLLTRAHGQVITPEMKAFMGRLRQKVVIGLVGGSDLVKIEEQMDGSARTSYDFVFAENGLTAFQSGVELPSQVRPCRPSPPSSSHPSRRQSFLDFLGEERLKQFINFTLHYIADLDIPQKRCACHVSSRRGHLHRVPSRHAQRVTHRPQLQPRRAQRLRGV